VKHRDNGHPAKLGCDELRYGLAGHMCSCFQLFQSASVTSGWLRQMIKHEPLARLIGTVVDACRLVFYT
jgi:hypothetical protein